MTQPQLPRNPGHDPDVAIPTARPAALVTGASGGIGLELARILARDGNDLFLVARSELELDRLGTELREKYGVRTESLTVDLSDPAAPRHLFDSLSARGIEIDVLINNAGFGMAGRCDEIDDQRQLDMIQVNIAALTELTRLFLPGMVQRGHGRIMNVASTAAFQPGPLMAVYYATKAYVLSFTQAVAEEVRNTGVTLTALCPGPTHTGFAKVANMQGTRLFNSPLTMGASDVAEYGYRAMMRGERVAIPGWFNRLGAFSTRLAPRRLLTKLARLAQENR